MRLCPPLPRAEHAVEMLDGPAPLDDLSRSLTEVARLNALFGGRFITLAHVKRLVSRIPRHRRVTVLDVGTGSADIARRTAALYPEILPIQGDALALPVRARSVDVVISALTLHHLEPESAVRCL